MSYVLLALGVVILVTALALVLAPADEVTTEVHIAAPPSLVWSVLTDGAAYGSWNPFISSMTGDLVEGGRITNVMRPAGGAPMTFSPTLLRVAPERELRWLGRLPVPRIFDGEHAFVLEPTEGGTRLRHGERFTGVAFWFLSAERFRRDFEAMNSALKARVEGLAARAEGGR